MKPHDVFVDTSGFYALLVKDDDAHEKARKYVSHAQAEGWTFAASDYVLDETATLLRARHKTHIVSTLFDAVFSSRICHVHWMNADRFQRTREVFNTCHDQPYSFTDCFSFTLMKELGLKRAMTKDQHFEHMEFEIIL